MICSSCPRKCNVDRSSNVGYCLSPDKFRVARAALHYWEEPCISGENGSGTVFFSGCNLRCVYCQNYEISRDNIGMEISDDKLIEIFEELVAQGANNINLVNPTHYAERLAEVLSRWQSPVPVIYNSSGYENVDTIKKLDGLIDIYLPDLKYIRNDKSLRYSKADDYFEIASTAIAEMRRQVADSFDDSGIMQSGLIVRHLILPQNTNSSIEILKWIKENLPDTYISLMAQYTPCGELDAFPELNRKITQREYDKVADFAVMNGFEKLFLQELDSADSEFIPKFDFTGLI